MNGSQAPRQQPKFYTELASWWPLPSPAADYTEEPAFVHCRPGCAALFRPAHVCESFHPSTERGGAGAGDRALRYLQWSYDPDPGDTTYTVDYACPLREADGSARAENDRHIERFFSRDVWLRLLAEAGFELSVERFDHSEYAPSYNEVFVGRCPANTP